MNSQTWIKEINVGITVCDPQGIIVEMNDQAAATFANDGGKALLGKSFWECHPEAAQKKFAGSWKPKSAIATPLKKMA